MMRQGPSSDFNTANLVPINSRQEREDRIHELQNLLNEKLELEEQNKDQV